MSMLRLDVKKKGFKTLINKLQTAYSKKNEFIQGLSEDAGTFMAASIKQSINRQKDPDGAKFAEYHKGYRNKPAVPGSKVIIPPRRPVSDHPKKLINFGTMRNDINFAVNGGKAVVGHATQEQLQKSLIHHLGLENEMDIVFNGKPKKVMVNPSMRKFIGFSNWKRYGKYPDAEWIVMHFLGEFYSHFLNRSVSTTRQTLAAARRTANNNGVENRVP